MFQYPVCYLRKPLPNPQAEITLNEAGRPGGRHRIGAISYAGNVRRRVGPAMMVRRAHVVGPPGRDAWGAGVNARARYGEARGPARPKNLPGRPSWRRRPKSPAARRHYDRVDHSNISLISHRNLYILNATFNPHGLGLPEVRICQSGRGRGGTF